MSHHRSVSLHYFLVLHAALLLLLRQTPFLLELFCFVPCKKVKGLCVYMGLRGAAYGQSSEQKERHTTNMVGGYTDSQLELHNKPITST
jgi:hypothetical protein